MADKAISDLSEALQIQLNDWFVLQQGSEAKKLSGNTLRQYLSQVEINSIQSVTFDAQGRCHILLADGTEIISQPLKGADGTDGTDGVDAPTITDIAIDANYHLIVTLSDGSSYDAGYCRGASGAGTGDMLASVYDAAAPTGGRSEPKQVAFSDDVVPKTDYAPAAKTAEMTQAVGKDEDGKLWTNPAPQGTFLPLSGGTMTGGINMDGSAVTGLPAPTNDGDAAPKSYVDEKVISFSCGDGVDSAITREGGYVWLDTGEVLNIPVNDYYAEVTVLGYGAVGSQAAIAHYVKFNFSNGEVYDRSGTNAIEVESADDFKWQRHREILFFGESIGSIRESGYGNGTQIVQTTYLSADVRNANITRIRVRAANSESGLHSMVIRFIKKDS